MKISINGIYLADSSLGYEGVDRLIKNNTYDSIGDAVISKLSDSIHHSEWYQHAPQNFDFVENFNNVQAICGDPMVGKNIMCYQDALNWSIMNKSELTANIYKFITHRVSVIRHGFSDNFWPKDFHTVLDMIDWDFILDCISWFF